MFKCFKSSSIFKRNNTITKGTVCILFSVQVILSVSNTFAEAATMQMRSIIVSISNKQAEVLSESKDPINYFAGKDISRVGPLELVGIFALLTDDSFNEVMARFNNLDPDYGDEDGPWVVSLPLPITERFAKLTDDDLAKLSERWANFLKKPENEYSAKTGLTFEQVKEVLVSIKEVCSESVSTKNEVFLWIDVGS